MSLPSPADYLDREDKKGYKKIPTEISFPFMRENPLFLGY
jgi:hypothetical protein